MKPENWAGEEQWRLLVNVTIRSLFSCGKQKSIMPMLAKYNVYCLQREIGNWQTNPLCFGVHLLWTIRSLV